MAGTLTESLNKELRENQELKKALNALQRRRAKERSRCRALGLPVIAPLPRVKQRKSLPGQMPLFD